MNEFTRRVREAYGQRSAGQTTQWDELLDAVDRLSLAVMANTSPSFARVEREQTTGNTVRVGLGRHNMPNQHRVHWHGASPKVETRMHQIKVWADITHPTIQNFIDDAVHCCEVAAVSAVITAVALESPAAGYAIFYPTFYACLVAEVSKTIADETSVSLGKENEYTCWTNHC